MIALDSRERDSQFLQPRQQSPRRRGRTRSAAARRSEKNEIRKNSKADWSFSCHARSHDVRFRFDHPCYPPRPVQQIQICPSLLHSQPCTTDSDLTTPVTFLDLYNRFRVVHPCYLPRPVQQIQSCPSLLPSQTCTTDSELSIPVTFQDLYNRFRFVHPCYLPRRVHVTVRELYPGFRPSGIINTKVLLQTGLWGETKKNTDPKFLSQTYLQTLLFVNCFLVSCQKLNRLIDKTFFPPVEY